MKLQTQTIKKVRSVRVKAIEMHTNKQLAIVGLYNGYLQTWNPIKCSLINETQVTEFPIRTLALIEKNNTVLIGADDGRIYVYELNNLQKLNVFDAHEDFIRKIIVNSTNTEFLSCSDDSTIKLWEIGPAIKNKHVFSGHTHFVMDICYNPKNSKQFISCSLDGTIKLWDKESGLCIKTFKGHKSGINTLSFCKDDTYFVSGSDDLTVKVWDLNNGNCISTFKGHTNNIINVYVFTKLPFIVSCSEDGSYRLWDMNTYENKEIINLNSGRVWQFKENNGSIMIGTDEELIFNKVKTGLSLLTMKNNKLFFTVQNMIYSCRCDDLYNLKKIAELGFYPSSLSVSDNSKTIAVCDDNNFYVHSSLGFRKKINGIGTNLHFVSNENFLIARDGNIEFFEKYERTNAFKVGNLKSILCVNKYIYVQTTHNIVVYTLNGNKIYTFNFIANKMIANDKFLIFVKEKEIFVWEFNGEIIDAYLEQDLDIDDTGIPDSFKFINNFDAKVNTFCLNENLFVFESEGRGFYLILQETPYLYNFGTVNGLIGGMFENHLLIINHKKVNAIKLDFDFINFQIKVLNNDKTDIKEGFRIRAISFFESLNMYNDALNICTSDSQKFEILIKLGRLQEAYEMSNTSLMYDRVGNEYLKCKDLVNATECFYKSKNWKSLLFVDLLCNKKYLKEIAENAIKEGENNLAFIACMKSEDYVKSGELLKNTKFYNFFKQTYLN